MFNRSRPWRARGPSLGSRAASRRRGCLDNIQPSVSAALIQTDGDEERFARDYAEARDVVSAGSALVTASLSTEQVVARIDEAGLRAMGWPAPEEALVTEGLSEIRAAMEVVKSPLDLFIPARGALVVISNSRRSA